MCNVQVHAPDQLQVKVCSGVLAPRWPAARELAPPSVATIPCAVPAARATVSRAAVRCKSNGTTTTTSRWPVQRFLCSKVFCLQPQVVRPLRPSLRQPLQRRLHPARGLPQCPVAREQAMSFLDRLSLDDMVGLANSSLEDRTCRRAGLLGLCSTSMPVLQRRWLRGWSNGCSPTNGRPGRTPQACIQPGLPLPNCSNAAVSGCWSSWVVPTGQVVFTSGGTEADNLAMLGICRSQAPGRLLISPFEHAAILPLR